MNRGLAPIPNPGCRRSVAGVPSSYPKEDS